MLTKAERKELGDLSLEVLGKRNTWQKILANGILVPHNEPGVKAKRVMHLELDAIKTYLLDLKRQKNESQAKANEPEIAETSKAEENV